MNLNNVFRKPFTNFNKIYKTNGLNNVFLFRSLVRTCNNCYCQISTDIKVTENVRTFKTKLLNGPNLKDFFKNKNMSPDWKDTLKETIPPYIESKDFSGRGRKVYFEVYGCQMNVNDTEVIWSVLKNHEYEKTSDLSQADVVLLVTCAIRNSAEEKIWNKLDYLKGLKGKRSKSKPLLKIGIVGCMAERLKEKVLERDQSVDLVVGPDAYRDLPKLLAMTEGGYKSVNVLLSMDETYSDIMPVRLNEDSVTAYVSIMRGCDNLCTYCIVPWTRGKERSRPISSILKEVDDLVKKGVKEVTLLGQNVNSYRDLSEYSGETSLAQPTILTRGFKTVYKPKLGGLRFAQLLDKVANIHPELRVRFTSPHPKDFPDDVLHVIGEHSNICKSLHLPAQSGNSAVLERMRRGYTREAYLDLIKHVRDVLPTVSISSDFICGFCGETDEEFQETLTLMEDVKYNMAFMFAYSMREKTTAHRKFKDDIPWKIKQKRLEKMINTYRSLVDKLNRFQIGQTQLVLIEGVSKRSEKDFQGRNDQNIKVVVTGTGNEVPNRSGSDLCRLLEVGDYVAVYINSANSQVLKGIPLYRTSLVDFYLYNNESNGNYKMQYQSLVG